MQTIDDKARMSLAMRLGMLRGEVRWFAKELDRELVKNTPDLDRLTRLSAQMREAVSVIVQSERVGNITCPDCKQVYHSGHIDCSCWQSHPDPDDGPCGREEVVA